MWEYKVLVTNGDREEMEGTLNWMAERGWVLFDWKNETSPIGFIDRRMVFRRDLPPTECEDTPPDIIPQ